MKISNIFSPFVILSWKSKDTWFIELCYLARNFAKLWQLTQKIVKGNSKFICLHKITLLQWSNYLGSKQLEGHWFQMGFDRGVSTFLLQYTRQLLPCHSHVAKYAGESGHMQSKVKQQHHSISRWSWQVRQVHQMAYKHHWRNLCWHLDTFLRQRIRGSVHQHEQQHRNNKYWLLEQEWA